MSALIGNEDRLAQAVAEVLDVTPETLSDESSPATIPSWDSLGHLNLIIALEQEFGVRLSSEDILTMRSIGSIRRILHHAGVEI